MHPPFSHRFATRKESCPAIAPSHCLSSPLRAVLAGKRSPELRRRVEPILAQLDPARSPKVLQMLRAVEVLEHLSSPQARELLQALADGAAEARLTREAKASLHRLSQRNKLAVGNAP